VIDLILVAGVIALSTLVAALVPSVRAALVDPAETLRAE
jgi:ABC-type lipoprotein release transport system permease subunit